MEPESQVGKMRESLQHEWHSMRSDVSSSLQICLLCVCYVNSMEIDICETIFLKMSHLSVFNGEVSSVE